MASLALCLLFLKRVYPRSKCWKFYNLFTHWDMCACVGRCRKGVALNTFCGEQSLFLVLLVSYAWSSWFVKIKNKILKYTKYFGPISHKLPILSKISGNLSKNPENIQFWGAHYSTILMVTSYFFGHFISTLHTSHPKHFGPIWKSDLVSSYLNLWMGYNHHHIANSESTSPTFLIALDWLCWHPSAPYSAILSRTRSYFFCNYKPDVKCTAIEPIFLPLPFLVHILNDCRHAQHGTRAY